LPFALARESTMHTARSASARDITTQAVKSATLRDSMTLINAICDSAYAVNNLHRSAYRSNEKVLLPDKDNNSHYPAGFTLAANCVSGRIAKQPQPDIDFIFWRITT